MELSGKLQSLSMNGVPLEDYMFHAKMLVDHLVATRERIPKREMVQYTLNGLGLKYLTFVTTFNMTQVRP